MLLLLASEFTIFMLVIYVILTCQFVFKEISSGLIMLLENNTHWVFFYVFVKGGSAPNVLTVFFHYDSFKVKSTVMLVSDGVKENQTWSREWRSLLN